MATIQKQVRMVFDLNKCLGCHTCTMACKTVWTDRNEGQMYMYWNNVETHPGNGYPKGWEGADVDLSKPPNPINSDWGAAWEYNYSEVLKTDGGNASASMIVPSPDPHEHKYSSNWDEDVGDGNHPNSYYFYLPRICNHCSKPACVAACPRKSVYKREEDGIVLIDQDRCRGYRFCVRGCPYKKPMYNPAQKISHKCIFCYPRIEKGEGNFCVKQCAGRIRYVGYYNPNDPSGPLSPANLAYNVNRLVDEFQVALRLHPEFGTEPNVFYIPPLSPLNFSSNGALGNEMRVPVSVLANMFGDSNSQSPVERETRIKEIFKKLEDARNGLEPELQDILIARRESDRIQV